MSHHRIERRSLALHKAIAAKLREKPELLALAINNLDRWTKMGGGARPYWDQWREILEKPISEVLTLLEEDSPRMTELRQSTPFAGVLEPRERWRVYDTFESGAHHPVGGNHR